MRLEYFQLLDRIVELDIANRTIRTEATVPQESTIFQGHFPGYPLMPGVLLLETMAQTSGWLVIGLTKFQRMPFLAAFKEALATRAYLRTVIDDIDEALGEVGEGHVSHRRH